MSYRSPQEAYYKRHSRPRRYSAGNDMQRELYRTYSDDQKVLINSAVCTVPPREVYQVCPEFCPPEPRYYGSTPRRLRRPCPQEVVYDPRELCCCDEEWYTCNRQSHYYVNDIPPCPPAPQSVVYNREKIEQRLNIIQDDCCATHPSKTYRSVSRSSSRELKMNGVGNAPYRQTDRRREESESEDDIITMNPVTDCHCSCDHLVNGNYRQLKEVLLLCYSSNSSLNCRIR